MFLVFVFLFYSINIFAQYRSDYNLSNFNYINATNKYKATKNYLPINIENKYSALNLAGQNAAGLACGFAFAMPSYLLANTEKIRNTDTRTDLIIFSLLSYVVGSATGVVLVANIENPKISFWDTFGYSAIGGALGILTLTSTFDGRDISPGAFLLTLVLPTFGSMIYSAFVSDWPDDVYNVSYTIKIETHKDLIEHTKLFNIELIRIHF